MKIAVQTGGILDHFGIDEGFRIIKEAGFDAVDFNIDHCLSGYNIKNNICESVLDRSIPEILESTRPYKEAAEKYGITDKQLVSIKVAEGNYVLSITPESSVISINNKEADGIIEVSNADKQTESKIYTLSGMQVKKATKGLYIINGKKYIAK